MAFEIDLTNVSYSNNRLQIVSMLKERPDYAQWESFILSAAGTTLIDFMAAMMTFITQKTIVGRRETYLAHCQNMASAIAIAQGLTYSISRGRNDVLYLVVVPDETISLGRWDIVGSVGSRDLILLEDISLTNGVPAIIPIVIGEIYTEDYTIASSDFAIFRFTSSDVSNDIDIYLNDVLVPLSEQIIDLASDYYVAISNPLGAVDVTFLNSSKNKTTWVASEDYNLGDFVEPTTPNGFIYRCSNYGQSDSGEPSWPVVEGESVVDNEVIWVCSKDYSYNASDTLTLKYVKLEEIDTYTISNDLIFDYGLIQSTTHEASIWAASTTYSLGDLVAPFTSPVAYYFECTTPGTSDSSEPSWNNTVGITTSDGTIVWTCRASLTVPSSPFYDVESLASIKVNAPVAFSTQQLVKARDDYMKLFKGLDSLIMDTNYEDVTPAVVNLTYVTSDLSTFNSTEKAQFVADLSSFRPMGMEPPTIEDPVAAAIELYITIYLKINGSYDLDTQIETITGSYEKTLEVGLDLFEIENQIDNLTDINGNLFIKAVRIVPDFIQGTTYTTWADTTAYSVGDLVLPTTPSAQMYRCISAGTSHSVEPDWTTVTELGDIIADNSVDWQCFYDEDLNKIQYDWNNYVEITPTIEEIINA
jgi:hypothetical protein